MTKCDKDKFTSYGAAIAFVRGRAWSNKRTGQVPVRAYWCGKCKAWHVTSKPSRKGRKTR